MSQHFIRKCVCGITLAQCRCPDPNKVVRIVEPCTHDNSVSQSDDELRQKFSHITGSCMCSDTDMSCWYWRNAKELIDHGMSVQEATDAVINMSDEALLQLFAAEHGRLLSDLKGKKQQISYHNGTDRVFAVGYIEAVPLAAIDAELAKYRERL